jgi:hypothetical protein
MNFVFLQHGQFLKVKFSFLPPKCFTFSERTSLVIIRQKYLNTRFSRCGEIIFLRGGGGENQEMSIKFRNNELLYFQGLIKHFRKFFLNMK